MSTPSAAFFLLAFALFVPTANALRCFQQMMTENLDAYVPAKCLTPNGCFKIACEVKVGRSASVRARGCVVNDISCGTTVTKSNEGECTIHCCTGNLCNGVLAMHTPAIGLAVLVPLVIGILAAAFGILY